jgi:hypothetical protein
VLCYCNSPEPPRAESTLSGYAADGNAGFPTRVCPLLDVDTKCGSPFHARHKGFLSQKQQNATQVFPKALSSKTRPIIPGRVLPTLQQDSACADIHLGSDRLCHQRTAGERERESERAHVSPSRPREHVISPWPPPPLYIPKKPIAMEHHTYSQDTVDLIALRCDAMRWDNMTHVDYNSSVKPPSTNRMWYPH